MSFPGRGTGSSKGRPARSWAGLEREAQPLAIPYHAQELHPRGNREPCKSGMRSNVHKAGVSVLMDSAPKTSQELTEEVGGEVLRPRVTS